MRKVLVKKRGKYYQYQFEIASQGGKRKWKTKSGFLNRASAYDAGCIAYNEYTQTGRYTKKYLRSILKVVKSSFTYAAYVIEFIKNNPSFKTKIPKYETKEKDSVHILTKY